MENAHTARKARPSRARVTDGAKYRERRGKKGVDLLTTSLERARGLEGGFVSAVLSLIDRHNAPASIKVCAGARTARGKPKRGRRKVGGDQGGGESSLPRLHGGNTRKYTAREVSRKCNGG